MYNHYNIGLRFVSKQITFQNVRWRYSVYKVSSAPYFRLWRWGSERSETGGAAHRHHMISMVLRVCRLALCKGSSSTPPTSVFKTRTLETLSLSQSVSTLGCRK